MEDIMTLTANGIECIACKTPVRLMQLGLSLIPVRKELLQDTDREYDLDRHRDHRCECEKLAAMTKGRH